MDIYTIENRYTKIVSLPEQFVNTLPSNVILFTTVQFLESLQPIKKQLEASGRKVQLLQPRHTCYKGQLLGCSTQKLPVQQDVVYIGDGVFHPKALVLRNNITVHTFNPKTQENNTISQADVASIRKRLQGLYARFLQAKNVGILLSVKPGQYKPQLVKALEQQFPNKTFYVFVDNTYNFSSLADFPFIDVFINTMCERIGLDDMNEHKLALLNAEDLFDLQNGVFDE